jgi:hypothetical protein
MAEMIENSLLDLDFAALTRRTFTPMNYMEVLLAAE